MPSTRKRMWLTLPPEVEVAVQELAEATDRPASGVVVNLLTEMAPQLRQLAQLTRHAKAGRKEAAKRTLRHMIGDAAAELVTATQPELPLKGRKR